MRVNPQHAKNEILANPRHRGPKRLVATAGTEKDDVNSHTVFVDQDTNHRPLYFDVVKPLIKSILLISENDEKVADYLSFRIVSVAGWIESLVLILSCRFRVRGA